MTAAAPADRAELLTREEKRVVAAKAHGRRPIPVAAIAKAAPVAAIAALPAKAAQNLLRERLFRVRRESSG